jgi:glycosyltransferase involved in cell wall biosynthesis
VAPRPRLLLLITLAETGGAQTYVSLLLPAVAERFDVTVAAHGYGPLREAASAAGVPFVPLKHVRRPIDPLRDVLGLVELVRLFRRERPEILHANSSKAGVLGRVAAWLAGVPIRIFTAHGWAFAAYRGLAGGLYLRADRLVRPLTTLVICVARRERELGVRAHVCVPHRSVVVHNAVDVRAFAQAQSSRGMPRIISVGRFAYPKDYATLVDALAAVETDYRAILVGEGPMRSAVASDVRRRGLAARIELLGGRTDVPNLLASADIFVLSSRSEGLPISVLEAMAAGLPVVATDVGGLSELVVDGKTGLLVPPADGTALAEAVQRLLRDPELRRRFGARARLRAEQRFDLMRFREAHIAIYRRELKRRGLPLPVSAWPPSGDEPRHPRRALRQGPTGIRRIGPSASR